MSSWADFPADKLQSGAGGDPWSADAWGESAEFHSALNAAPSPFDSSESQQADPFDMSLNLFPEDPIGEVVLEDPPVINVAIHEQLSALYDGEEPPESQVIGSIHVSEAMLFQGIRQYPCMHCPLTFLLVSRQVRTEEEGLKGAFCLVVKDSAGQLEQFVEQKRVCCDITDNIPYSSREVDDRILRVTLPSESEPNQVSIADYSCTGAVHPIPLVRCFQAPCT